MPWLARKSMALPEVDLVSFSFSNEDYDIDKPVGATSCVCPHRSYAQVQIYHDLENPQRTISKRQGKSIVRKLVAGFRKAGLQKGDCFSITSFNDVS